MPAYHGTWSYVECAVLVAHGNGVFAFVEVSRTVLVVIDPTPASRPLPPPGDTRLPDLLDCVLVWAMAEYESGRVSPIDQDELEELTTLWVEGFDLDAERSYYLSMHTVGDLDWVEIVVEGLWGLAGTGEEASWSTELLTHIAHLVGTRLGDLETWKSAWAMGVTPTSEGLTSLLRSGFPSYHGIRSSL